MTDHDPQGGSMLIGSPPPRDTGSQVDRPRSYMDKKEAGTCTRRGCNEPAAIEDGVQLCPPHRRSESIRQSKAHMKRRAARRRKGLCAFCPNRSTTYRCPVCTIAAGFAPKLNSVTRSVTTHEIDRFRPDSAGHRRFRGKVKRGKPSTGSLDDQDLDWAAAEILKARTGLAYARSEALDALPAAQRSLAVAAALARLDLAEKFFDEVRARHKGGKRQRKR